MTSEDIKLAIIIATFFISLCGMVWKMSALNSQVKENTKDLSGVGMKVSKIEKNQEEALADVKEKIGSIEMAITKISVSMDFISKQIEGAKAK